MRPLVNASSSRNESMRKFESHITLPRLSSATVQLVAQQEQDRCIWLFSMIDGDAIMGNKPYCYLTSYHTDGQKLLAAAEAMAVALRAADVLVLRIKVEEIVYDSKTGHSLLPVLKTRPEDQPLPTDSNSPLMHDLVCADVQARKELGTSRYGKALQANNGRDALLDLYQELLDATAYARQSLFERDGR